MKYRHKNCLKIIHDIIISGKKIGCFVLMSIIAQTACSQKTHNETPTTDDYQSVQTTNKETSPLTVKKTRDLGNGFEDHGIAVPVATSRGTVAAMDEKGHHLILTWLYDQRGTYSLLLIDADSKNSKQFTLPFAGDSFTSLLSSKGRYYTHFKSRLIEFDVNEKEFRFIGKTSNGNAMSMTEDDNGIIWAALAPNCNLISYNPDSQKIINYGSLNSQKARQLPRSIAADDKGWIYVTAGSPGEEKIVTFNPKTSKTQSLQENSKNKSVDLSLFRAQNGEVFSKAGGKLNLSLYQGKARIMNGKKSKPKKFITGNQALFNRYFPDGLHITDYVSTVTPGFLRAREVTVDNPKTGKKWDIPFNYKTKGAQLMGVAAGPDGMIIGGSYFPYTFFRYNPAKKKWFSRSAYGQTNTLAILNNQVFLGTYPNGALLQFDPNKEWISTKKKKETNPQYLTETRPFITRPHDLLSYPDGHTVIMAGRPTKKKSEGGLLFWDLKTQSAYLLETIDKLPNQSTHSLVALGDDKIMGGTTIIPGDTGGKRLAKQARLYIMDLRNKKIVWSNPIISGMTTYDDLCDTSDGLIMGVANREQFFVFDPDRRKVVYQLNLKEKFGSKIPYTQGQRSFVKSPGGNIYLLLQSGILRIDSANFKMKLLAKAPENITGGGAYLDGKIYYISGGRSKLYSYTVK